jgi:hypothetical protein
MMKKVTITLDEEVARWARVKPAEEKRVSKKLVGEMLREKMLMEKSCEASMQSKNAPSARNTNHGH